MLTPQRLPDTSIEFSTFYEYCISEMQCTLVLPVSHNWTTRLRRGGGVTLCTAFSHAYILPPLTAIVVSFPSPPFSFPFLFFVTDAMEIHQHPLMSR